MMEQTKPVSARIPQKKLERARAIFEEYDLKNSDVLKRCIDFVIQHPELVRREVQQRKIEESFGRGDSLEEITPQSEDSQGYFYDSYPEPVNGPQQMEVTNYREFDSNRPNEIEKKNHIPEKDAA